MRAEGNEGYRQAGDEQPVEFRHEWCKKCGICIAFCPRKVLAKGLKDYPELVDAERCARCKLCELMCPDFVITVAERQRREAPAQGDSR